ncbi:MAG: glycosyltransferase family 4 protein [Gemmatimonadales bacterium]
MTLNVLHFHSGNIFGGVERLLLDLAGTDVGVRHAFALCWPGETADRLRAVGTVHLLEPVRFSRPWQVRRARRRARALLAESRPDRVVTHSDWSHAIFGPESARAGVLHVRMHHSPPGHPLLRWAAARVPTARHVANSRWTASHGLPHAAILYPPVRPPVVHTDRETVRRTLGTPPDVVVIVMVARMEAWKGHCALIDAFATVDLANAELWIVGGPQSSSEEAYAAALPRPARVRFLGQRRDVADLLAAADVYCQPNAAPEPFGIAIVEALYMGLPVIATHQGGPAEIVAPTCGALIPPNDHRALVTTLSEFIVDPSQRQRLSAGGPPRAAALCDPVRQATAFAALLRDAGDATFPRR